METPIRLLLKTTDAARALGVSAQTIRRWSEGGVITPAFIGPGGVRYFATDTIHRLATPPPAKAKRGVR
jgi:DNA-binding transcriptional MerR regulator